MPLRSVEAASRDDAIAAAREQFGPSARIVGVRRVRSGGVLGFFATERYVAEVDPDHPSRAAGRDRESARTSAVQAAERAAAARRAEADTVREIAREARAAERVSELAGLLGSEVPEPAAPPIYSRSTVTRVREPEPVPDEPAPFDAAWFEAFRAESARTTAQRSTGARPPSSSGRLGAPRTDSFRPEPARFQPARVDSAAEPARAVFPRAAAEPAPASSVRLRGGGVATAPAPWSSAAAAFDGTHATAGKDDDGDAPGTGESPPRSPFTAALARMVAGDRDVRQAVQAALDDRDAERSAQENARPSRPRAGGSAATPATGAGHQEEDSVTEQGSPSVDPGAVSRREEAIAEVLRTALEQGHSDEALADILRKVLASTAPQVSLPQVTLPEESQPLWDQPVSGEGSWAAADDDVELPADAPIWAEVVLHEPVAEKVDLEAERAAVEARAAEEAAAAARAAEEAAAARAAEEAAALRAAEEAAAARRAAEEAAAAQRAAEEAAAAQRAAEEAAARRAAEEAAAVRAAEEAAQAASAEEERAAITTVGTLARTASDPAPFAIDATSVMPPLSLLPPLPGSGRRGSLPPVPPAPSRPAAAAEVRSAAAERTSAAQVETMTAPAQPTGFPKTLATVVRLPVAPIHDTAEVATEAPSHAPTDVLPAAPPPAPQAPRIPTVGTPTDAIPAPRRPSAPVVPAPSATPALDVPPARLVAKLRALGIPDLLLGPAFVADAEVNGTYEALTRALGSGLPPAPAVPEGAGEVLFVVGPGVDTLRAARSVAASLRLDPERVQWATRGELAGLAPKSMATIEAAVDRRTEALAAGTVTVVAVDAPLRTDAYWMAQMLAIWSPVAVWAVVDATRKPEDVEPWIEGLPRVDALMVQDTDLSADPAAVLDRIAVPVALLDGAPATPHRWASLLCERLEKLQG